MTPGSGWRRRFDDPITVGRSTLLTLPEKTSRQEHWQIAIHHLMLAAERGGIMMLARIAMLRAFNHGSEPLKAERRKRAKTYRVVK